MRISSIQNTNYYAKTNVTNTIKKDCSNSNFTSRQNLQLLPNFGYGKDLITRKQPVFTGNITKAATELVQQIPIEIGSFISRFKAGRHYCNWK